MTDPASDPAQARVDRSVSIVALGISTAILAVLARRLGVAASGVGMAALYAALPKDYEEIENIRLKGTQAIVNAQTAAAEDAATQNDGWASRFYKQNDVEQRDWTEQDSLSGVVEDHQRSMNVQLWSDVASTGLILPTGQLVSLQEGYRWSVERVGSSGKRRGLAIAASIIGFLTLHGLRTVEDDGSSRNMVSAVSHDTLHDYRSMVAELRKVQGIEYGADGVQVSAHEDSAPDHVPYQGRMYTNERFREVQSDLPRELVYGAGCRHYIWPVMVGEDASAYTKEELEEMNRHATAEVSYRGVSGKELTKTGYEWSQYRKSVEERCRTLSSRVELYGQMGDVSAQEAARRELSSLRAYYSDMCAATGQKPSSWATRSYIIR